MVRNKRALLLAGMALVVLGAVGAANAQAAEFHCSVEPCRYTVKPDGTGKTAHQVFLVKNSIGESFNFTCTEISGEATSAGKAAAELTVTNVGFGAGLTCQALGLAVGHRVNNCDLAFGAAGTFSIKLCKGLEFEILETGCLLKLPEQGPISGVSLHNVGEEGKTTTELTGEINSMSIAGSLTGTTAQCGIDTTKTPITVEYKTGNFLITGETDPGGVMANAW
jgi:hypothetical protein